MTSNIQAEFSNPNSFIKVSRVKSREREQMGDSSDDQRQAVAGFREKRKQVAPDEERGRTDGVC